MALVTDYASLQTWIAQVLNRADLAADIPNFIQDAEASLRRDPRARLLVDLTPFSIDAEEAVLPTDFGGFEHLSHDGPTYYHPIETVAPADLPASKAAGADTGVPIAVSIIERADRSIYARFGPEPDATYSVSASYWSKLTSLSDIAPTNRLLLDHPDIYRYAALVEAAPYLKDDVRVGVWEQQLQKRLNELHSDTENKRWGGTLSNPPRRQF